MQLWRTPPLQNILRLLARQPQVQHCLLSTSLCRCLNHYEVLGLQQDCSQTDVKDAFVRLSKQWHPDRQSSKEQENQHTKFVELNTAYSVLSKPQLRAEYDAQLRARGYHKYGNYTIYNDAARQKVMYEDLWRPRDGGSSEGRNYYGVPWIKNKLSNSTVVSIVVAFMLLGMVAHFYIARMSRDYYVRQAERRDLSIAASYREVRERALGSDRRAQLVSFQRELNQTSDTQFVGGQTLDPQFVGGQTLDPQFPEDKERDRNRRFIEELAKSSR